jgi:hypothetical protein
VSAFVIHGNLDCEAKWAGTPLPAHVATRVSYYAVLLAALAPRRERRQLEGGLEPVEVWAPAAVDPEWLRAPAGWRAPVMRVGAPPRADLAWAHPHARLANDRRLALAVASAHGAALPGARVIESPEEIDLPGPWICKVPWTAAGRDRCRGAGAPSAADRARLQRLLRRTHPPALVLEPWCDRMLDVGVCGVVEADGIVVAYEPHTLLSSPRGGLLGIDLTLPPLTPSEREQLSVAVAAAGAALAALAYTGPFAVDAFAYRDASGARRFHPLCEINARYSFGWLARALAARLGARRLGFGPPPPGATELVGPPPGAPAAMRGIGAWCA